MMRPKTPEERLAALQRAAAVVGSWRERRLAREMDEAYWKERLADERRRRAEGLPTLGPDPVARRPRRVGNDSITERVSLLMSQGIVVLSEERKKRDK
jgi:hypothetical protein